MKDIHSGITVVQAIGAAVLAADSTPAAIDLQGHDAAEVVLAISIGGITFSATNKIEFKLTHSDDDNTYAPVTVDDSSGLLASGTAASGSGRGHAEVPRLTRLDFIMDLRSTAE